MRPSVRYALDTAWLEIHATRPAAGVDVERMDRAILAARSRSRVILKRC